MRILRARIVDRLRHCPGGGHRLAGGGGPAGGRADPGRDLRRLLKPHGDPAALSRGELAYGEAKAEVDAVIGALIVALAKDEEPAILPDVEKGMSAG